MAAHAIKALKTGAQTKKPAPRSFGAIVRDLLIERGFTTAIGNPNWPLFASQLEDVQYESLTKAVTGERRPSPKIMEAVAEALSVSPDLFWEYRLAQVQRRFDPDQLGEDEAYANLVAFLGEILK